MPRPSPRSAGSYHGNGVPALAAVAYERAELARRREDDLPASSARKATRRRAPAERARTSRRPTRRFAITLGSVLLDASRPDHAAELREAVRLDPAESAPRGPARAEAVGIGGGRARGGPGSAAERPGGSRRQPGRRPRAEGARTSRRSRARHREEPRSSQRVVRDLWFRDVQALGATAAWARSQAEFLLEAGKPDQAAKVPRERGRPNPGRADSCARWARARLVGQLPRARDEYLRALALEPSKDARARRDRHGAARPGEMDEVARARGGGARGGRVGSTRRVVLAQVRLPAGRRGGALADLAPLIAAHPDNPLAQVVRGDALLRGRAAGGGGGRVRGRAQDQPRVRVREDEARRRAVRAPRGR